MADPSHSLEPLHYGKEPIRTTKVISLGSQPQVAVENSTLRNVLAYTESPWRGYCGAEAGTEPPSESHTQHLGWLPSQDIGLRGQGVDHCVPFRLELNIKLLVLL